MNEETESRYPKLEPPQFKSAIPAHLLDHLCVKEKWVVEQLSLVGQKVDWLVASTVQTNADARDLDGRLSRVERFTGKWALIGAGCAVLLTILVTEGVKIVLGKLFP